MRTLEMLLDMAALVADAGTPAHMDLELFGDDAASTVLNWARSRGIPADPPEVLRDDANHRIFTAYRVPLSERVRVIVHGTWKPVPEATSAIDVAPGGGAA